MPLKLLSSGGGSVLLTANTTGSNFTVNVPAVNGNMVTTADTGSITQSMLGAGVYAGYGPAFIATRITSNQSLPSATWTKISFNSTDFDTNSVVNTSTGTITPTVAGYYNISASAYINYTASALNRMGIRIYKNGSAIKGDATTGTTAFYGIINISSLVYCNGTTDYIEIYAFQASSSDSTILASGVYTYCSGFLARAA